MGLVIACVLFYRTAWPGEYIYINRKTPLLGQFWSPVNHSCPLGIIIYSNGFWNTALVRKRKSLGTPYTLSLNVRDQSPSGWMKTSIQCVSIATVLTTPPKSSGVFQVCYGMHKVKWKSKKRKGSCFCKALRISECWRRFLLTRRYVQWKPI